ncbi:ABC transporter ATP-binding protein [Desulforhopalus singaporensis]|uniref:Lipopolysaccharide transport system ATP-binding protein n=1 Tax=Desulforhopalus singaporensis TaxID=91360 RepID=A0A1H0TXR4_9BACT|nr:ABC transporter ATP-binding protein [Desulforhopalus singaporensis]SDP58555.1 lipopolysaccharide transport system ATP-binding protein [Desulforhopalus singaporensis]
MFSDFAIKVENLSKCYQIYDKPHYRLLQMLRRGRKQYYREFWALRNVTLGVKKGTTVGILGRNGSGKSTLLKMICGTLNPTDGVIETHGRIAAILELGSGFNPEFTGRENVYMKGSILGLKSDEIDSRFASIASFAEIGDFMDQPVRTYSSGMMVRLAFAVSVNVDPEILVVDEALSVGDERFQRKCFSRIEAIREAGATILFVSHSGATVVQLCDHAVLLDDGEKLVTGSPKEVYGRYQQLLYAPDDKREQMRRRIKKASEAGAAAAGEKNAGDNRTQRAGATAPNNSAENSDELRESFNPSLTPTSTIAYESSGAVISEPKIKTIDGKQVNNLVRGKKYHYCYRVKFTRDAGFVRFGMLIKTKSGVELGGAASAPGKSMALESVQAGDEFDIAFEFGCALNPGTYFLNAGVMGELDLSGNEISMHRLLDAAMFKVLPDSGRTSTGIVDFGSRVLIDRCDD